MCEAPAAFLRYVVNIYHFELAFLQQYVYASGSINLRDEDFARYEFFALLFWESCKMVFKANYLGRYAITIIEFLYRINMDERTQYNLLFNNIYVRDVVDNLPAFMERYHIRYVYSFVWIF